MMNLLPECDKKVMRAEHMRRTIVVLGIVFVIAAALGVAGLMPSLYFVTKSEHTLADAEEAVNKQLKLKDIISARSLINDINRKIAFLSGRERSELSPSDVIDRIVAIKPHNISLTSLRYTVGANTKDMTVSGTTESRRAIVSFVSALENERSFIKVVSPVSNLLKGSDIEFSIKLTLRN